VLGLGTGFLVFYWILTRLPRTAVPRRGVVRNALVGAVGFEVLKQAVAVSIGSVTGTPGGAVFGPLLGLLLFCYLVSRFALLVSAWAATTRGNELPAALSEPASPPGSAPAGPSMPGGEPAPSGTPAGEPAPLSTPEPPTGSARRAAAAPGPPGAARGALGVALGVGILLGAWLGGLRRSRSGAG
jgi:membrane protein